MNEQSLKGKSAFITGSVQGIGYGIAQSFAQAGAKLAVHGICDQKEADNVVQHMKDFGAADAKFFNGDLRDAGVIDTLMHAVEDWSGGVDILVNNAGIQKTAALTDVDNELWDSIIAVNLSAAFHTMRFALPRMAQRKYGRVVNISSVHGLVASINKAPYVSAKHGLVGLSKVVALEYASVGDASTGGVTVNCICPGWTSTTLVAPQFEQRAKEIGGSFEDGVKSILAEKQPSLRMSETSEIGSLALWLCQISSHNVTGTSIPIEGGWTAQ